MGSRDVDECDVGQPSKLPGMGALGEGREGTDTDGAPLLTRGP